MSQYTVMVDDNFHYMEADERWQLGTFATLAEAISACQALVDRWLADNHKPGMTGAELYSLYVSFGEDPFIVSGEGSVRSSFSAWDYAKSRAATLCGGS